MGNAAFLTASFAIIAKEFPDNVATTFVSTKYTFYILLVWQWTYNVFANRKTYKKKSCYYNFKDKR